MTQRLLHYAFFVVSVFQALSGSGMGNAGTTQSQTSNWTVTILSARKDPEPETGRFRVPAYNSLLAVRIKFTYAGPEGQVLAPIVAVVDDAGNEFQSSGDVTVGAEVTQEISLWLLSGTAGGRRATKLTLEPGTEVGEQGGIQYYFAIPKQTSALRLRFADAPPLAVELERTEGITAGAEVRPESSLMDAIRPALPVRVGGQIKEPKKLKHVEPAYPDSARQARVQGIVILDCTISPEGKVTEVKVLRGIPLLDEAAIDAARQWVYTPTLLNGAPVPVIMTVTVKFTP